MRPIHPLNENDNRWFIGARSNREASVGYAINYDVISLCAKIISLVNSHDPIDRLEAYSLVELLPDRMYCPGEVWVCRSIYKPDENGIKWSDKEIIWSAHLNLNNALQWHEFWTNHWGKHRKDYEMLPVRLQRDVHLHALVHPAAEIGLGVTYP